MSRTNLTAGRISKFALPAGAEQTFLWDSDTKTLAVRATAGARAYIFQSRFNGKSLRITIGHIKDWAIDGAREEARRRFLVDAKPHLWWLAAIAVIYGLVLAKELGFLALFGLGCIVVLWIFQGIASLPVSVAVIIGALIIAGAVSR